MPSRISSAEPEPEPTPVVVNIVPTLLSAAPISVKSVSVESAPPIIPVPVPSFVAENVVPTLLLAAPIFVKSVVPTDLIL